MIPNSIPRFMAKVLAILSCMLLFASVHAQLDLTNTPTPSYTSRNNANNIAAEDNFVHVVYTEGDAGNEKVLYTQSLNRGNTWEDNIPISANWDGTFPSIAVHDHVVHVVFFSTQTGGIFYVRSQDNGETWEAPVYLTSQAVQNSYPSLAVNGSALYLAWENGWEGDQSVLFKSSMDGGTTWSDDTILSESGANGKHPSIVTSDTHVHLVYQDEIGIQYRRSLNDGADWSDPMLLGYSGQQPSIAVSDNLVMVVWMNSLLSQIYSVHSSSHGDTWGNETTPVENYAPIMDAKIVSSGNFFYLIWAEKWNNSFAISTATSTDGGMYFTNYGFSLLSNDESIGPHATVVGRDVHLLGTTFRTGNNQEIVYMQLIGYNPMAGANEFDWGFGFGNESGDSGEAIALDTADNVYVAGYFSRTVDFDPSVGVINKSSKGGGDIFVAKYNPEGHVLWAYACGGIQHDKAEFIYVDPEGNVYVSGYFRDLVDFDPGPGILTLQSAGDRDVFVLKLDQDGNFIWAKGMGGPEVEYPGPMKINEFGHVISVGSFSGNADFDPGPDQKILSSSGTFDIYISILDANGNLIKAESIGGPGDDLATDLALTASNSIMVTGYFTGSVDFDPGIGEQWHVANGKGDFFILRLNADGQWEWSASLGSSEHDNANSIEIDPQGNIVVVGEYREDADMDPGPGTHILSENGSHSIFVLKLDSLGQFRWAKAFPINDLGYPRMRLDAFGCIYIVSSFQAIDLHPPSWDIAVQSEGQDDALLMKIDTSGDWMWINPLRSSGYAIARDIALQGLTEIYVTGHFTNDLDPDPSTGVALLDIPTANYTDFYLTKNRQCIPQRSTQTLTVCGRYEAPDGKTFFNSGNYRIVIPAGNGCDSVITLHLTVLLHSPVTRDTVFACDQFTTPSGAFTWTHSGSFYENLTNVAGCDSFVIYHLTIFKHSDPTIVNVTACNSYTTPDGLYTWTASGMYEAPYVNIAGCDSSILYQLEINVDQAFNYAVSACETYTTPDGLQTWDSSGTYSYHLLTAAGCDSIITVDLDIIDINLEVLITDSTLMALQANGNYQWYDCANGEIVGNETGQTMEPTVNGLYAAIITLNDCQDTTDCIPFTVVGDNAVTPIGHLRLYPNPADRVIYFEHNHTCEQMTITFMDVTGRKLVTEDVTDCHTLELPEPIRRGIYFIRINLDGKEAVERVVVE